MTGHGEKLSRTQEQAIAALLTHPSIAVAARHAGIGEKTLRRWLKQPAFKAAFRAARQALVDEAVTAMQRLMLKATKTLERNLTCGKPEAENTAARAILEHGRMAEMEDLLARIEALEQARLEQASRAQGFGSNRNGGAA